MSPWPTIFSPQLLLEALLCPQLRNVREHLGKLVIYIHTPVWDQPNICVLYVHGWNVKNFKSSEIMFAFHIHTFSHLGHTGQPLGKILRQHMDVYILMLNMLVESNASLFGLYIGKNY